MITDKSHILTRKIPLVALPFTWLRHMIPGVLIRACMGSERSVMPGW
jgi:hypothetical protein